MTRIPLLTGVALGLVLAAPAGAQELTAVGVTLGNVGDYACWTSE